MPRNCVQHQKGLSDDAFEQRCPDEEACRKAWFAWRWPEGFKCPRCAGTAYCQIQGRQLLQCRRCRHQTSLIADTILQGDPRASCRRRNDDPPVPYRLLKLAEARW
jgi:transposase-like zinc ribbon protein